MSQLSVKSDKYTYDYEICDYTFSQKEKYLKITKYYKKKYSSEENINLSELSPEFYEIQSDKLCRLPLIFAWIILTFVIFIFLAMLLSVFFEKNMLLPASGWGIPLGIIGYFLTYLIKKSKIQNISKFCFTNNESERLTIPYTNNRQDVYNFVCEIAKYCNQDLIRHNSLPGIKHQFANGTAELQDNGVVLFNKYGIECGYCEYSWCVPGLYHHTEKHIIRNFICTSVAIIFWLGALFLFIFVAITFKGWEIILGFGVMEMILLILGSYFFSMRKKSVNYYFAGNRFENADDWGIYLEVGKNPGSEKAFTDELNSRLRKAHDEILSADETN